MKEISYLQESYEILQLKSIKKPAIGKQPPKAVDNMLMLEINQIFQVPPFKSLPVLQVMTNSIKTSKRKARAPREIVVERSLNRKLQKKTKGPRDICTFRKVL